MKFQSTGISADADTNAAGVTVRVDPSTGGLRVTATSLGIQDQPLPVQPGDDALDWTRTGVWTLTGASGLANAAPFVTGYETPLSGIPTTGTATYNGSAQGVVYYPSGSSYATTRVEGTASFTADFDARSVNGNMTGMKTATDAAWNNVSFNAQISSTQNGFSGNSQVTSAPGGAASLAAGATGTIEGRFYGPSAQEAGAVWTLHDGNITAEGTIRGTR